MGHTAKTRKGDISVSDNLGRIRLLWRVNGQRYSLNLPFPYTPENLHHAAVKVTEIKLDILKRDFDTTLEKYKSVEMAISPIIDEIPAERKELDLSDLAEKFYDWTAQIKNINIDHSVFRYNSHK